MSRPFLIRRPNSDRQLDDVGADAYKFDFESASFDQGLHEQPVGLCPVAFQDFDQRQGPVEVGHAPNPGLEGVEGARCAADAIGQIELAHFFAASDAADLLAEGQSSWAGCGHWRASW